MNIDRIAREMVDIEPSRNLEARIRARLDAAQPERRAAWWSWRVAAPLTAAAAIALIIGVQVFRSLPAGAAPAGAVAQAGPEIVRTPQLPNLPTSKVEVVRAPRLSKAPASLLSGEELAWMERRLPALDPVNALQMDRLRLDSIQPEPLGITPLTMTQVATESGGVERHNDR